MKTTSTARARRSPFGASPPESDGGRTLSISDAVRRCRWIAVDINAAEFGLFFVSPSFERTRLIPGFDSAHPGTSTATGLAAGRDGEEIVRHIRVSSLPCWWSNNADAPARAALAALEMASRSTELVPGSTGIAFPVFADRGQSGLVVFLGRDIMLDNDQCLDVHARCFSLFGAVATMMSGDLSKLPAISRRELECLKLTANGMTSEQIATALKLSVHTANQYLTNSTQKLNAANRTHAVAKALKLGLFT